MSVSALETRVHELEETVATLAAWLVSAQTGFGKQDYDAINKMIEKSRSEYETRVEMEQATQMWDDARDA